MFSNIVGNKRRPKFATVGCLQQYRIVLCISLLKLMCCQRCVASLSTSPGCPCFVSSLYNRLPGARLQGHSYPVLFVRSTRASRRRAGASRGLAPAAALARPPWPQESACVAPSGGAEEPFSSVRPDPVGLRLPTRWQPRGVPTPEAIGGGGPGSGHRTTTPGGPAPRRRSRACMSLAPREAALCQWIPAAPRTIR